MNKERSLLKNGSTIALDGSWSHRRNAGQCVISFINATTNKILDIEILEKNTTGVNGNYEGSSTSMEVEDYSRDWAKLDTLKYIYDSDGKTMSVFKLLMPTVLEQIDKNHLIKASDMLFKKFNTKTIERTKGTFSSMALHCCSDESHRIRKLRDGWEHLTTIHQT